MAERRGSNIGLRGGKNPTERDYLEDLGVDGLILKYFYALNLSASA